MWNAKCKDRIRKAKLVVHEKINVRSITLPTGSESLFQHPKWSYDPALDLRLAIVMQDRALSRKWLTSSALS